MGWKKPSWVQKVQNTAQSAANTVKAALPPPPKVVAAPSNTNVLDKIGGALKQGTQWLGNTVNNIVAPGTSDRTPTVKIAGPNPLEQDRMTKKTPTAPENPFNKMREKDFEGLKPLTSIPVLDDANVNPLTVGIQRARDALAAPAPVPAAPSLPEEGITVASAGAIPMAGKKTPTTLESIADTLTTGLTKAGKKVDEKIIKPAVETFKEGTDNMETRVIRFQYGGIMKPEELEAFRQASAANDTKTMDAIRSTLEARKKAAAATGGK